LTGWTNLALGEVVTFQRGFDITKKEQREGAYPVISSSGPTSTHVAFKFKPPGVVIGRKGSLGGVYFANTPYWPHDTTLWVRDFHGNDARFVFYFLQTLGLERFDVGASNPTLNRNHLHAMSVTVPPRDVQRKIAAALSAYDDLIENNDRRITVLEEMIQRIYREWFVEFRYPGHENVPSIESGLGPTPEGWTVQPMAEIATVIRGRSYRGAEITDEGGVPFINLKCIAREGGFRPGGVKRYVGDFKSQHMVVAGDIVVAVTDMTQERRIVARAARVPEIRDEFGVFSMDLVKVVPREVPGEYLYGLLRHSGFADEVKAHANGANVLHLHPDRISEYKAVLPPRTFREDYSRIVAPMYRESDSLTLAVDSLRKTRDLLLTRLFSGEVDVAELSITLPDAAE